MKTFLVKKDVNKPHSPDNWIIMNSFEFSRFMKTEDGQRRKKNFANLGQCDMYDDIVIIECGNEKAKEWESERLGELYHRKANDVFTTIPYDCSLPDKDNYCCEDVIPNTTVDVEDTVLKNLRKELLYEAIQLLTLKEQELIRVMYLSKAPVSLKKYAKQNNICMSSAYKRKIRAFRKLKKYFKNCGYDGEFFA